MSKNVSATSRKKFNDNKSHRVFSFLILYLCSCSFVISNYFIFAFFQSIWIFETIFIFHKSEAATVGNYSLFSSLCLYIVDLDIRCWQLTDPSCMVNPIKIWTLLLSKPAHVSIGGTWRFSPLKGVFLSGTSKVIALIWNLFVDPPSVLTSIFRVNQSGEKTL